MIPWRIVDSSVAADGTKIELARRGDEWEVRANRTTLMTNRAHASEEALARLAFERTPGARRVLIGGLGLGYSLRATLDLLPVHGLVTVAEISAKVVSWNRSEVAHLAGRPLDDPRARVFAGDVRDAIEQTGPYDAILLDVDNGPRSLVHDANERLYNNAGIAACAAALSPGGALVVWSLLPDEDYLRRLRKAGFNAACLRVPARIGARKRHVLFLASKRPFTPPRFPRKRPT
jgi:spermidine synthase